MSPPCAAIGPDSRRSASATFSGAGNSNVVLLRGSFTATAAPKLQAEDHPLFFAEREPNGLFVGSSFRQIGRRTKRYRNLLNRGGFLF